MVHDKLLSIKNDDDYTLTDAIDAYDAKEATLTDVAMESGFSKSADPVVPKGPWPSPSQKKQKPCFSHC